MKPGILLVNCYNGILCACRTLNFYLHYQIPTAPEHQTDPKDRSEGQSAQYLLPEDLTYPYVKLSSVLVSKNKLDKT